MSDLPFSESFASNNLVFISGQVPLKEDGTLLEGSMSEQTHQTMKNIEKVLKAEGLDFSNVVMAHIYMTDLSERNEASDTYISYFKKPYPARVNVGVSDLPLGAKIEIAVIASK